MTTSSRPSPGAGSADAALGGRTRTALIGSARLAGGRATLAGGRSKLAGGRSTLVPDLPAARGSAGRDTWSAAGPGRAPVPGTPTDFGRTDLAGIFTVGIAAVGAAFTAGPGVPITGMAVVPAPVPDAGAAVAGLAGPSGGVVAAAPGPAGTVVR
ncbi:MAG: hypothetical protein ACRDYZ_11685, partial [Acidimicrobiales bacterium]